MNKSATRFIAQLLCTAFPLAASSLTILGCGDKQQPIHVYQGIDTSESWAPYLPVSAKLCAATVRQLNPDQDRLTLYRVDNHCREFFDGMDPKSGDRFEASLVSELASLPSASGTYPANFFSTVAERAAQDPASERVAVTYFSDGDNDDGYSKLEMTNAANALAANPRITSVEFCGANPDNWGTIRSEFSALGSRLHLVAPTDMSADGLAGQLQGSNGN